ncbi:hypothetical protein [Desulfonatronospira sp.]|nr:hypothetical protein [Desulfonatronospira sp.]
MKVYPALPVIDCNCQGTVVQTVIVHLAFGKNPQRTIFFIQRFEVILA